MFLVGYQNNQIGLTKLQIKDLVIYSLSNCYFIVGSGILCHINGILMRSGPAPFFHNLFINFYESNCMNEKKRNELVKTRINYNVLGLLSIYLFFNDGEEFESNYINIYPRELKLNRD